MNAVEDCCLGLEERVQCRVAEMKFELAQSVSGVQGEGKEGMFGGSGPAWLGMYKATILRSC